MEICTRGERLAPSTQLCSQMLELVKEDMTRLKMRNILGPSFIHHLLEPRHLNTIVIKLERSRSSRPQNTGQKQRAMVREGGWSYGCWRRSPTRRCKTYSQACSCLGSPFHCSNCKATFLKMNRLSSHWWRVAQKRFMWIRLQDRLFLSCTR
jgi:hypothetical protein